MGKRLEIKGANFSANAIERVTPIPLQKIIDFDGACDGTVVSIPVDLISTSATDWTMFAQFAWQGGRTGEIRLFDNRSTTNVLQFGYTGNKQFYKSAGVEYSASALIYFDNSIRKIGFRKKNGHIYVTFDGVSWTQTQMVLDSNIGSTNIFSQAPVLTELRVTVWNDPDYNIAPLFQ